MRYISVFSGIEAASCAWEPLGWEPVAFSEIEPFPCAVLSERYPDVPNLGDITEVDWSPYRGSVDVVVGGSPCQSFSIAGGREGLDGESRLMYEYIRCVQDVRPRWLLWENVPGVFSIDGGRAFGILLDALAELGYSLAWRVLDAQFFGVAQRRRRVFLVGHIGAGGAPGAVLFESESVSGNTQSSREKREELAARAGRGAQSKGGGVTSFKWQAGAAAGTMPTYDDGASHTLTTDAHPPAVAFAQNTRDEVRVQGDGEVAGAISAQPGMNQTTYVLQSDGSTSQSSHGSCYTEDDLGYTVNGVDKQSVVYAVASGQANAEVIEEQSPSLTCLHEQPIVIDRAAYNQGENAAYPPHRADGSDGRPRGEGSARGMHDTVGALCARDSKGVGEQYVREGKVIVQEL